jgi:hypothetical protein
MPPAPEPDAGDRDIQDMGSVPGRFLEVDARMFVGLDTLQKARGIRGDRCEMACSTARARSCSAAWHGPGESPPVGDRLRESERKAKENIGEHTIYHRDLRRRRFERQYRRSHGASPRIHGARELCRGLGASGIGRIFHSRVASSTHERSRTLESPSHGGSNSRAA